VRLEAAGPSLAEFLGDLPRRVKPLEPGRLKFAERRTYDLRCNWKVFVDNYLDGGYHVPHIHKGLGSVLDYGEYRIENFDRCCVQSSPIRAGGEAETASVRGGGMAYYYWLHPNFMLNWYEGVMDTNLVLPLAVDRTRVVFDFYFADGVAERERSIAVSERIQREDIDICESVQRGLGSRAYQTGRLSVRREAGEHLFHRMLHADMST
jgi:choline monooxygenase